MGTPIVDRAKLVRDLAEKLAKRNYTRMLARENQDRQMRHEKDERRARLSDPHLKAKNYNVLNAEQLAAKAVDDALGTANKPNLIDPIIVVELKAVNSDICLYRMYDGISHKTALTLGRWWCNRALMRQIWHATSNLRGEERRRMALDFLRAAMFVHPSWNYGTNIAQMKIPAGCSVPAIMGRGSWEAMKSSTSVPAIETEDDVIDKLGVMPIPGPKQVFLPVFNDMWVRGIPDLSPDWPLN